MAHKVKEPHSPSSLTLEFIVDVACVCVIHGLSSRTVLYALPLAAPVRTQVVFI